MKTKNEIVIFEIKFYVYVYIRIRKNKSTIFVIKIILLYSNFDLFVLIYIVYIRNKSAKKKINKFIIFV